MQSCSLDIPGTARRGHLPPCIQACPSSRPSAPGHHVSSRCLHRKPVLQLLLLSSLTPGFSSCFSLSVALCCLSDAVLLQPLSSHQASVYIAALACSSNPGTASIVSAITKPRNVYFLPLLASAKCCQQTHHPMDQRNTF